MILDEKKFAEDLYCGRNTEVKSLYEKIFYITKYQLYVLNYSDDENYKSAVNWLYKNHLNFEEFVYSNLINDVIRRIHSNGFYKIDYIGISNTELDTIKNVNNIKCEKLLFVLLCMAKFQSCVYGFTDGLVNYSLNDLFKQARVTIKSSDREFILNDLLQTGLISIPKKNDTSCLIVNFIDNQEPVLKLDEIDCKELAYSYLQWKNNGGYQHCEKCGRLFRKNKNRKYCKECSERENQSGKIVECCDCHKMFLTSSKSSVINRCPECQEKHRYEPTEIRIVKCIDCGKEFKVTSKDTITTRCKDCYNKYRRQKKTETMRRLRLK